MKDLNGKVSVITGAGAGLGRELAMACARRRMKLVLADVEAGNLEATRTLIQQELPDTDIATLPVDVSKFEQVAALAQLAMQRFGGVHLLFNNAGVGVTAPLGKHRLRLAMGHPGQSLWCRLGRESLHAHHARPGRGTHRQYRFGGRLDVLGRQRHLQRHQSSGGGAFGEPGQ